MDYLKEIYPSQLTVEKANKPDHLADYLDLTFIIDSGGKLSTRPYDKRDDFDFHIVNFPFLSSNIPSGPSYGVYVSLLIRYARSCSQYDDFRYHRKCLVDRLLSQGYLLFSYDVIKKNVMQNRSYRSKHLKCYRQWHFLLLYQVLWHSDQRFLRHKRTQKHGFHHISLKRLYKV